MSYPQHWLVTVDVKMDRHYWMKQNHLVEGDVGCWYAQHVLKQQCPMDFRFVGAVPVSYEGAKALKRLHERALLVSVPGKKG